MGCNQLKIIHIKFIIPNWYTYITYYTVTLLILYEENIKENKTTIIMVKLFTFNDY